MDRFQIGEDLSDMDVSELLHGLELDDHVFSDQEVRAANAHLRSLVLNVQRDPALEGKR